MKRGSVPRLPLLGGRGAADGEGEPDRRDDQQHGTDLHVGPQRAEELIHGGKADDGLLNTVEMFFRAYDPCFACASHTTGQSPLEVNIRNADGSLHKRLSNFD